MSFLIHGLDPARFAPLFALSDAELADRGARRVVADDSFGFPCRVSLADAAAGDELILLSYEHHATTSPYRGQSPIYVRHAARERLVIAHRVPEVLAKRILSVRAYDSTGMLVSADLVDGRELAPVLDHRLRATATAYLQLHVARTGCFLCEVTASSAPRTRA
jgi:hypothetical protein